MLAALGEHVFTSKSRPNMPTQSRSSFYTTPQTVIAADLWRYWKPSTASGKYL